MQYVCGLFCHSALIVFCQCLHTCVNTLPRPKVENPVQPTDRSKSAYTKEGNFSTSLFIGMVPPHMLCLLCICCMYCNYTYMYTFHMWNL